jgi:hypothetical protein
MRIFPSFLVLFLVLSAAGYGQATDSAKKKTRPPKQKPDYKALDLKNRANDHFLIQFGYDGWASKPDSINTKGFSRHFNFYLMYDMPFKTDPRWSVAIGAGVGSSNIFFDKTSIRLVSADNVNQIAFRDVSDTTRFNKYKLTNVWLEAPIEIRYLTNPAKPAKSFKVALGAKVGTMVSAYTKGKDLQSSAGQSLFGNKYIVKEKERSFFNNTRLAGTLRIGYGLFTVHGSFQVINLFRDGSGPPVRPYSIGLSLGGL